MTPEHLRLATELWWLMSFYQWSVGRAWWGFAATCMAWLNIGLLRWVS